MDDNIERNNDLKKEVSSNANKLNSFSKVQETKRDSLKDAKTLGKEKNANEKKDFLLKPKEDKEIITVEKNKLKIPPNLNKILIQNKDLSLSEKENIGEKNTGESFFVFFHTL